MERTFDATRGARNPDAGSISVVIPAYNSKYLSETLDSILRQTRPPDEILVIDDGSTDNTAALAESYGPPVKVFRRQNQRQGACRNFGVQQATSEWIAFMDHDDLWEPSKLEHQMQELHLHPEADLCYTGRQRFRIEDGEMAYLPPIFAPDVSRIRRELFQRATFLPSCVLVRRSAVLAVGGFATHYRIADDWDMWLRLLHSGIGFASCREPLLLYRIHAENTGGDGMVKLRENAEVFRRQVLPHLSGVRKWFAINRFWGENEGHVASLLRKKQDNRCVSLMIKAILHLPFEDPYRYKVLLHMLYTLAIGRFERHPAGSHRIAGR